MGGRGLGERDLFREGLGYLEQCRDIKDPYKLFELILKYGRADDVWLSFNSEYMIKDAARFIANHLTQDTQHSRNIAKWIPRKPKDEHTRKFVSILRSILSETPKSFRKRIVRLTNVVEQKICENKWGEIKYENVPSQAMHKLRKAFRRHDENRFDEYIKLVKANLEKPVEERDTKIKLNAGTIYPYQILNRNIIDDGTNSNAEFIQTQWESLPDYLNGKDINILPMLDVSGSMYDYAQFRSSNPRVIDISTSLGIYLMERNKGSFHNTYLAFAENPILQKFDLTPNGQEYSAFSKYQYILNHHIGYSTNFEKAVENVLGLAKEYNVPQSEMPKAILIISDMNFDSSWLSEDISYWSKKKATDVKLKERFKEAGYEAPKFIFWNVNHNGSFTCKADSLGFIQLSGWSSTVLKDVLENIDELDPIKIMMNSLKDYLEVIKDIVE